MLLARLSRMSRSSAQPHMLDTAKKLRFLAFLGRALYTYTHIGVTYIHTHTQHIRTTEQIEQVTDNTQRATQTKRERERQ